MVRRSRISLIFFFVGLAGIIPLVTGISDEEWTMAAAFLGFIIAIVSFVIFSLYKKRAKVEQDDFINENLLADWQLEDGEIKVYTKGIIYDGEMYLWDSMDTTLEGVGFDPSDPKHLIFLYRMLASRRMAKSRHTIDVTIPEGEEAKADRLVFIYNKPLPEDYILKLSGKTAD